MTIKPLDKACRYASHFLEVEGGHIGKCILVEYTPEEGIKLMPFRCETSHTVFLNGTLYLTKQSSSIDGIPLVYDAPSLSKIHYSSPDELQLLVDQSKDWELWHNDE
ncbi:hypothetical protein [Porphyromonas pogonae]|uniref:hypothetical protein n=1 Tax=Porphyromonas pogonae TaxID=867595 RepID=UPI002E794A64|nr:hypothetical protein [Porphyromonas pogonae]